MHLCLFVYLADQFYGVTYLDFLAILVVTFFKSSSFVVVVAYYLGNLLLDDSHEAALIRGNFGLFKLIFVLKQDDRFVTVDDFVVTALIVFFFGFHIVFKLLVSEIEDIWR